MFESIAPSSSIRPRRRPALLAAGGAHLVLGCALMASEAWSVEAVAPPDLPPVFHDSRSIPVVVGTPEPTRPRPAPPLPENSRKPDPGPRQPETVTPLLPGPQGPVETQDNDPGSGDGHKGSPSGVVHGGSDDDVAGSSGPSGPETPEPPPIDRIYDAAAVDVKPARETGCGEPRYPGVAVQLHLQGDVQLTAVITETGDVEQIQVRSGNPILAQAAVEAAARCHYTPARLRGRAVRSLLTWDVHFVLR